MALSPTGERRLMCVQFLKRERNLTQPTIDLYLACVSSKILEHVVHSFIMKHLNDHNILTDCQHGFRAKRSTEMQLILTLHDMAKAIQSSSIHAAVLDFAKAFYKVPHRRLLKKLQHYGIQGSLLNWLESFLTQRFQSVFVKARHQVNVRWLLVYPRVLSSAICSFYYI